MYELQDILYSKEESNVCSHSSDLYPFISAIVSMRPSVCLYARNSFANNRNFTKPVFSH
jgi:hypothetical protein